MQNWKRTFSIIWTGQFISLITSSMVNFAIILWLSIETRSEMILAYAAIATFLPQAVLGLFTGVLIDRWDRKLIMMFSDGFIAVCTLLISLMFFLGQTHIWLIYVLLGLRSVGAAFHMPAMQASVPLLAPEDQLLRISGINQAIQSVSMVGGPALGALAIGLMDIEKVLLFDVGGAVLAIVSLIFVHIPRPEKTSTHNESVWLQVKEGLKAVTTHKGMTALFVFSVLLYFLIFPIAVMFPLMTLKHFNGDEFQMSLIEVVWGLGMLVGGGVLGILNLKGNKVILVNLSYAILGLAMLASGLLSSGMFVVFVILTAIGGVASAVYNAGFTTIIQQKIDPAVLGRVFSMMTSISLIPSLTGLMGTGFLADNIGITRTFVVLGGAIGFFGVMAFFFPRLMALDAKTASDL